MVEPISTSLMLGGGWFANKILGPSADEVGGQLKAYVSDKLKIIVSKAEKKSDPEVAKQISPAFFFNFAQKAAFSEDSEDIIDMWASLLADAGEGQNYKHAIYADILTKIGSREVKFLSQMLGGIDLINSAYMTVQHLRQAIFSDIRKHTNWGKASNLDDAKMWLQEIDSYDFSWPVQVKLTGCPYIENGTESSTWSSVVIESDFDPFVADVVCKERLIESFKFESSPGLSSPWIEGYLMTHLGANFILACQKPDK